MSYNQPITTLNAVEFHSVFNQFIKYKHGNTMISREDFANAFNLPLWYVDINSIISYDLDDFYLYQYDLYTSELREDIEAILMFRATYLKFYA